jgi:hypothetical protein
MSIAERRLIGLQIVTGLVVAFVRHGLERHRIPWDLQQFLISWFIHTVAVIAFTAIAAAPIIGSHKFFLGYEYDASKDKIEQLAFYLSMAVLVASVCILCLASYVPADDYD